MATVAGFASLKQKRTLLAQEQSLRRETAFQVVHEAAEMVAAPDPAIKETAPSTVHAVKSRQMIANFCVQ